MVANGRKWFQTVANGRKGSLAVANPRKQSQMVANGRKLSQTVEIRHKCWQTFANGCNIQFIFSYQTYSPKFPAASATGTFSLFFRNMPEIPYEAHTDRDIYGSFSAKCVAERRRAPAMIVYERT